MRPNSQFSGFHPIGEGLTFLTEDGKPKKKKSKAEREHRSDDRDEYLQPYDYEDHSIMFGGDSQQMNATGAEAREQHDSSSRMISAHAQTNDEHDSSSETSLSQFADTDDDDPDVCSYCGKDNDWKHLFQCSYCFEWAHLRCYNDALELDLRHVPSGLIACHSYESCFKKYQRMVESGFAQDIHGLLTKQFANVNDSEGLLDDDNEDESFAQFLSVATPASGAKSALQDAVVRLQHIRNRQPITFASAKDWTRTLSPMSPEIYNDIVDAVMRTLAEENITIPAGVIHSIRSARPPQNIRRRLADCGEGRIKQIRLAYKFLSKNVEGFYTFWYRDPVDAIVDLHESTLAKTRGPVLSATAARCSTGRLPDIRDKVERFSRLYVNAEDPYPNLVLPIGLYSDDSGSASRNVEFCPVWLIDLLMDPDVRFLEKENAHILLGLLPVASHIEYGFLSGHEGPAGLAATRITKSQRYKALLHLRKAALQQILLGIKAIEQDGRLFDIDGVTTRVRVVLVWYISDMKERRILLNMRKGVYDCTRCYAFPGHLNEAAVSRGRRTSRMDKLIRKEFEEGYSSKVENVERARSAAETFKLEYGDLGLTRKDECAFTDSEEARIFTMEGPYELFNFDALHNKDGVINYFMKFLEARLGDDFIKETEHFGNVFLQTGRHSMHVMEKGLESFHFIPLAVALGDFKKAPSEASRHKLFLGACDLLVIISLLTDPCPAYVAGALQAALVGFKECVEELLFDIANDNDIDAKYKMTTKLHELTEHVTEQIKICGLPSAFSSKLFETFHHIVKVLYMASSKRSGDGSSFKEIVLSLFYRMAIYEAELRSRPNEILQIPQGADWHPEACFHIANNQPRMSIAQLIRSNAETITKTVFRGHKLSFTLPRFASTTTTFGSTLRMWIQCRLRKRPASQECIAVVPGTSKGRYHNGGCFNGLVYKRVQDADVSISKQGYQKCDIHGCTSRHHRDDFQLFCSAARDDESSYGLPLLFVDDHALVWQLRKLDRSEAKLPAHRALLEVQCVFTLEMVSFDAIRGVCMLRACEDRFKMGICYLFPARNAFGYKVEN
jgi:hypothetical protein